MADFMDFGEYSDIRKKIEHGTRLTFEDGVRLYRCDSLPLLGSLAASIRRRFHGNRVCYAVNYHLNYTNICETRCLFCAFSREADAPDAYFLEIGEIERRVRKALRRWPVNEIHIVGGHAPNPQFGYYLSMIECIRAISPDIHVKAFSASEIDHVARHEGFSVEEILRRLKTAGLSSLPGGGAEIFDPRVRERICPRKISGKDWLNIHRTAHRTGIPTNATMLYGHLEDEEARVAHVLALRELQDETQGFRAFVPLPYWGRHASLEGVSDPGGVLTLKVFAVSRLLLDNIPHLKIHIRATGLKLAQVALAFGADDIGGTNFEESIYRESGSSAPESLEPGDIESMIREAGRDPCCVNSGYQVQHI